jgi:hypothetical protein
MLGLKHGLGFKITAVSAACLVVAVGGLATAPPANAYSGYSYIADFAGECLGVSGGTIQPGQPIIQWKCNFSAPDQYWTIFQDTSNIDPHTAHDAGVQVFHNEKNAAYCLSVNGNSYTEGAQLVIAGCDGGAAEQWDVYYVGDRLASFRLTNMNSGLVVGVAASSKAQGAKIVQWPYIAGDADQVFGY